MALVTPGGANTFIPTFHESTGLVQIEYSLSPTKYKINRYIKVVPVEKSSGFFLRIDEEAIARLVSDNDTSWRDGSDAPEGDEIEHEFTQFTTNRHTFTFKLGDKAVSNADFQIVAGHARIKASLAMRRRSWLVATELTTTGNWVSGTTATSTSVGGGQFTGSTEANSYIQKSFNGVAEAISANTNEVVEPGDITAIMNDIVAHTISESPEYKSYFKGSPFAAGFVRGSVGEFDEASLLSTFFGIGRIVIDKTTRITTRKKGSKTRAKIYDDDIVFVSRVGGMAGVENVPDFSTLTLFVFEDMVVETLDDRWNRRIRGRVTDDVVAVLTAPRSGYLLQDVI